MHIGIDASRAAMGVRTGTEHYTVEVLRRLVPLGCDQHRFTLYSARPLPPELQGIGATARVIPVPRLWTHLGLGREVLRRPPDLLWVPAHVLPFPSLRPRRKVATIQDLGHLYYPEAYTRTQWRYLDWGTRWNIRNASLLLAISYATRDDLVNHYGVDPASIRVTQLGVDAARRIPAPPAEIDRVRQKYNITAPYILSVGTVQPRKNIARLVEAFNARINADLPHKLVLVGKQGWLTDRALGATGKQLQDEKRLIITGYVPEADLHALLSGADVFALVSLFEGFGLPLAEAMALGIPSLTSTVSSLPEVAGDAALMVDPHDVEAIASSLHHIITDEPLRTRLRLEGPAQSSKFTWERCAAETLQALEESKV